MTKIVRKPDTDFTSTATFKDLNADSLDIVQILVAVEDAVDIGHSHIHDDYIRLKFCRHSYPLLAITHLANFLDSILR